MRLFKRNVESRKQGAFVPQAENLSQRGNYISNIVKKKYYNYYNIKHRVAVCKLDGIGNKLTYRAADRCIAKTFKFYTSHEVDGVETMQEQRARWIELNCDEILNKCITSMIRDGFVLLEPLYKNEKIDYNVYSEFEAPIQLWKRDADNKIIAYGINYTPKPRAIGSSALMLGYGGSNLKAVKKPLSPQDVIHCEYGETNLGLGMPLIEAAWDSIMKLHGASHQEMIDNRTIPTLHLTEDDYDEDESKAKGMLKMVANSDTDIARVWYHKVNKMTGLVSEYPRYAQESPSSNPGYNTRNKADGISTGDFGNIPKEWGRLTTVTGHSVNWFMGNRAGATVGSETDKLNDDEQEIIDFKQFEKLIRKILEWLASKDIIALPDVPYVIKYWKDWEAIELAEKTQKDLEAQGGLDQFGKPIKKGLEIDDQDNEQKRNELFWLRNLAIFTAIDKAHKENISHDMTYVWSSWIDMIGYDAKTDYLWMQVLSGQAYYKPAPLGEWSYIDWVDAGSLGGYYWDYLSQRDPPWQKASIPAHLLDNIVDIQNTETKKVAILDYQLIDSLDTAGSIRRLGHENDWSMGTGTSERILRMLKSLKKNATVHQKRFNTMTAEAFGNSIKENHPLLYDIGNGNIVEEYICPEAWKKAVNTVVPLGVYHNVEEDIPELPEWQIVGTAEVFGWDDDRGEDYVKYNYDYDKIDVIFERLKQFNWLTPILKEEGTSDISTAYYADIEIKWNDLLGKFVRVQTNIELISISFVPQGNCPGEVCSLTVVKNSVNEMQEFIANCIADGMDKDLCLKDAYYKFKAST